MNSFNLEGVQEWLERWMKKSGNLILKILTIKMMTLPEDDEDEEAILNCNAFAE
jgi:hypothetical protein